MWANVAKNTIKVAAATGAITGVYVVTYPMFCKKRTEKIVIVGGGTAGIGVAAMLQNEGLNNVTIVEPSKVRGCFGCTALPVFYIICTHVVVM